MNAQASLKPVEVPLPADGALMLAAENAGQIEHDCNMAVSTKSWGGHVADVKNARAQLSELARRLGYELVPARGGDHG
jgi:hypothetical protein